MIVQEETANGEAKYTRRDDWVEVKAPELFNFDTIGKRLEGVLVNLQNETIDGKAVLTARMRHKDGTQTKFRPSFDLQQKIGRAHMGKLMLIVFDSERDTGNAQNKMKVFRVFVAPGETKQDPPFVATDADLPGYEGEF
jgi:hypothetical protein